MRRTTEPDGFPMTYNTSGDPIAPKTAVEEITVEITDGLRKLLPDFYLSETEIKNAVMLGDRLKMDQTIPEFVGRWMIEWDNGKGKPIQGECEVSEDEKTWTVIWIDEK